MKLIDTSVWVAYINGELNLQTELLHEEILQGGDTICTCPIIIQEFLQGFKDDKVYQDFKERLLRIRLLRIPEPKASIQAADIYRKLRKSGITIRKTNDCIIANYALQFKLNLVHNDRDFDQIATLFPLKLN